MLNALSGPHLWVFLASLIYLGVVVVSVVRACRLPRLSLIVRVAWSAAILLVPLGGLVVFWATNWPRKQRSAAA